MLLPENHNKLSILTYQLYYNHTHYNIKIIKQYLINTIII